MVVHNSSVLEVDILSTNLGGAIVDSVVLTKTKGCNFGTYCDLAEKGVATTEASSTRAMVSLEHRDGRIDSPSGVDASPQLSPSPSSPSPPAPLVAAASVLAQWRSKSAMPRGTRVPAEQVDALVSLYHATGGQWWTRNTNWLTGDPCDPVTPW